MTGSNTGSTSSTQTSSHAAPAGSSSLPQDGRPKVAVVDGNSLMHRAFHAISAQMTSPQGVPTNAVFGFLSMFLKLVEDFKGRQLLLFGSQWAVNWTAERNPNLTFSEFGGGI